MTRLSKFARSTAIAATLVVAVSRPTAAQSDAQAFESGKTALTAGRVDSAISAFRLALRQNDTNSGYHFWLGQA